MAASTPLAPPPPLPPAPTAITALSDDLLREIFLRLPAVTSLVRAAFTCRTFLRAVVSSPAFRRRFRELHAPPLLAILMPPDMFAIVPTFAGKSSSITNAFVGLLKDSDAEWQSDPEILYRDRYASFLNQATDQGASYSPHSQALNIYPKKPLGGDAFLEFHTLSPECGEEQQPSHVVCIHHDRAWAWVRVAVFSSHTMEWQVVLPEMETGTLLPKADRYAAGTVVNGFICWVHMVERCILALNTATFQFSRMDLPPLPPPLLPFLGLSTFQLGQTKDGELCLVSVQQCMLSVWLWVASDDGVKRVVLHKTFALGTSVCEVIEHAEESDIAMRPIAVINGFVYLSVVYFRDPQCPEWFLSFCLETAEVNLLHKESSRLYCSVDPYVMVSWPSSLTHGKQDSETEVTGNISEDDGPAGTEEAAPVLFTALQSFKQNLIDDGNTNFAEIDDFLLDDERISLVNRIATLESKLAAARDRVVRLGTESNSMKKMEIATLESGSAAANLTAWKGWKE